MAAEAATALYEDRDHTIHVSRWRFPFNLVSQNSKLLEGGRE